MERGFFLKKNRVDVILLWDSIVHMFNNVCLKAYGRPILFVFKKALKFMIADKQSSLNMFKYVTSNTNTVFK